MARVEYDHKRKLYRCLKTNKIAHKQEIDAIMSAYHTSQYGGHKVWHYKCPDCKRWHITKVSPEQQQAIEEKQKRKADYERIKSRVIDRPEALVHAGQASTHPGSDGRVDGLVWMRPKSCCVEHAFGGLCRVPCSE